MAKTIYTLSCHQCDIQYNSISEISKFCSLKCSCTYNGCIKKHDANIKRTKLILKYNEDPNLCKHCGNIISFKNKANLFCSQSCSATYTNLQRGPMPEETKEKISNSINEHNKNNPKVKTFCKVAWCIICNSIIKNKYQATCSKECKSAHISNKIKLAIQNGHDPNKNRGRGKQSYLEKSFEDWLKSTFPDLEYKSEYPFKRLDTIKTYFADFYFPSLNLIIELDGTQHLKTQKYDKDRDNYIINQYKVEIIRISHKEYKEKSKIDLIISKLTI